jgi:hypothetical protein
MCFKTTEKFVAKLMSPDAVKGVFPGESLVFRVPLISGTTILLCLLTHSLQNIREQIDKLMFVIKLTEHAERLIDDTLALDSMR